MNTTGDLRDYNIITLLRLLIEAKRTGILTVQHGDLPFEVALQDGEIRFIRLGTLKGALALSTVLLHPEGMFRFEEGLPIGEADPPTSFEQLVFEALGYLEPTVLNWGTAVRLVKPEKLDLLPLSQAEQSLVQMIKKQVPLPEILRYEGGYKLIWKLYRLGMIKEHKVRLARLKIVSSQVLSSRATMEENIMQRWAEDLGQPITSLIVKDNEDSSYIIPVKSKPKINAQLVIPVNMLMQIGLRAGNYVLAQPYIE